MGQASLPASGPLQAQWFCAFNSYSGLAVGKGFPTKSAESCRAFWLDYMLPTWPKGGIHLIMDNLSAHKKAFRELPARIRRRFHVYWTPTNSSWLNLVESYFFCDSSKNGSTQHRLQNT
ncbi:MAG: transposase [Deltaproteobacteria bacterium]|nr:transposase [Deltaproteobacteria bacterium]